MSTAMTLGRQVWPPRITALLLAGLLGASGVYWGIKLFGQSRDSSAAQIPVALFDAHATQTAGTSNNGANAAAIARLLGANVDKPEAAEPTTAQSNYQLTGVVAVGADKGAALIASNGQAPKAVRVGAKVDDQLYLLRVVGRTATLGPDPQGPGTVKLELPTPSAAAAPAAAR